MSRPTTRERLKTPEIQSNILIEENNVEILDIIPNSISASAAAAPEIEEDLISESSKAIQEGILKLSKYFSFPEFAGENMDLAYLHFARPNDGLSDILMLKDFKYLQVLELSGNKIQDLSVLGDLQYLVRIDLSKNKITKTLDFSPSPLNLQEVDLSRNLITVISDLSSHRYLKRLNLSDNMISEITGISECFHLTHLSIARNNISEIKGLENLPISHLDLSHNNIVSIQGLESLKYLEVLNLSNNGITEILGIEDNHPHLRIIDLSSNFLDDADEIGVFNYLPALNELSLQDNPFISNNKSEKAIYRSRTLHSLSKLTILDGLCVSAEEKVAALNKFSPPPEVTAAAHHAEQVKRQIKQYARIKAVDLMQSGRLRPIVLCGPSGVGKRTLIHRLLSDYPHIFGRSVSHTTRKPKHGEENGVHYYFVSNAEMQAGLEKGSFIESVTMFGNIYGTSFKSIDRVTEEGKICLMDLEIEGAIAMKKSHLKPRFLCITVTNVDTIKQRLDSRQTKVDLDSEDKKINLLKEIQSKIDCEAPIASEAPKPLTPEAKTEEQILTEKWLLKAEASIKAKYNVNEFFDSTIFNDNLDIAYNQLKKFCLGAYWLDYADEE